MKAKELKKMSPEDLDRKLVGLREELFNLRFRLATNQLENPHKITDVKHDIARVKTAIRERELDAARR
ncbi:MAG TPA: 50S ribosomal protein L29 [Firmicutes bacterium]|jgi:large subunit ribosomal protein L29|nr:50S ribosomal protein L29 [Bacillota bacterium]HBK60000.1 50S ribosomal protein L29 [Bacillota bacterium]